MPLEVEQAFWEQNKKTYKQAYKGKFLVIYSRVVATTYQNYFGPRVPVAKSALPLCVRNSYEEAFCEGVRRLGADAEFMVKDVDETPVRVYAS